MTRYGITHSYLQNMVWWESVNLYKSASGCFWGGFSKKRSFIAVRGLDVGMALLTTTIPDRATCNVPGIDLQVARIAPSKSMPNTAGQLAAQQLYPTLQADGDS